MTTARLTPYTRLVTNLAGMERAAQVAGLRRLALYLESAGPQLQVASRFIAATAGRVERETGQLGPAEVAMIAGLEGAVTSVVPDEELGSGLSELLSGGGASAAGSAPLGVETLFRSQADAVVSVAGNTVGENAPVLRFLTEAIFGRGVGREELLRAFGIERADHSLVRLQMDEDPDQSGHLVWGLVANPRGALALSFEHWFPKKGDPGMKRIAVINRVDSFPKKGGLARAHLQRLLPFLAGLGFEEVGLMADEEGPAAWPRLGLSTPEAVVRRLAGEMVTWGDEQGVVWNPGQREKLLGAPAVWDLAYAMGHAKRGGRQRTLPIGREFFEAEAAKGSSWPMAFELAPDNPAWGVLMQAHPKWSGRLSAQTRRHLWQLAVDTGTVSDLLRSEEHHGRFLADQVRNPISYLAVYGETDETGRAEYAEEEVADLRRAAHRVAEILRLIDAEDRESEPAASFQRHTANVGAEAWQYLREAVLALIGQSV